MKISTVCLFILAMLPFYAQASEHAASCTSKGCTLDASGTINLSQTRSFARAKNIAFKINDNVQGVLKLYHSKANNKDMIKGEFLMNNAVNQKSYLRYKIVFKDPKGAVGQTKGDLHLSHGKNQKMKFGSIVLSAQDMKNINSYQIQVYASDKKFK